jgi:hypothetical protein
MVHSILSLSIRRPELVIDHVAGHAALVEVEATDAGTPVGRRAAALPGLVV